MKKDIDAKLNSPQNARRAVQACVIYLKAITDEPLMGNPRSISVEEIQLSKDGKTWCIVLSRNSSESVIWRNEREYKEFKVDSASLEVVSMRMKKLDL